MFDPTYLGFLDKASLFELLLRFHYIDLWNLCKVRTYLYKIITTEYFQEEWKKYNITTVIGAITQTDIDRSDLQHGKTISISISEINEIDYVQDKIHGLYKVKKKNGDLVEVATYVEHMQHGRTTQYKGDGGVIYLSYVNDKLHGVCKRDNSASGGHIHMVEYADDLKNGLQLSWFPSAGRQQMYRWKEGKMHGLYREWFENGVKKEESTYVEGKYHGSYKRWNELGKLTHDEIRDKSKEY